MKLSNTINKNNSLINYIFIVFSFLLIFEILIRAIIPGIDGLINIFKLVFSLVFIIYIFINNKKINIQYKYIYLIFITFFIVTLIKLLKDGSLYYFYKWIVINNNINYFMVYVYFIILTQLREKITYDKTIKALRIFNYIIIFITIILFLTNNYLGMVSYENMIAYAWVGTNKMRVMSIFGNPNHAGLYFVIILFILDYSRVKNKKSVICFENIIVLLINFLTFSRTSIFISIVYLFIRGKLIGVNKKKNFFRLIINKYKILIVSSMSIIILSILVNKYGIYFFNINYLLSSSRWERWGIGIKYAIEYPFIGTPFSEEVVGISSSFSQLKFSDNMFIEIASRFGNVLSSLVIIYIIYQIYKAFRNKDYYKINKLQTFIISSFLSGTIHFSVPVFLFIYYVIVCKEELSYVNKIT